MFSIGNYSKMMLLLNSTVLFASVLLLVSENSFFNNLNSQIYNLNFFKLFQSIACTDQYINLKLYRYGKIYFVDENKEDVCLALGSSCVRDYVFFMGNNLVIFS